MGAVTTRNLDLVAPALQLDAPKNPSGKNLHSASNRFAAGCLPKRIVDERAVTRVGEEVDKCGARNTVGDQA